MDIIETRITGDFKEDVRTLIRNKIMRDEMGDCLLYTSINVFFGELYL